MSLPHDSAHNHVTGKSEFVDDRSRQANEVFCEVIFSTKAHARIKAIHFGKALAIEGIIAAFTGDDFHHNRWGTIFADQPILASKIAQYAGEPIALLVGKNLNVVRDAKEFVEIEYEPLPAVLSIAQAIREKSFIDDCKIIHRGDAPVVLKKAPHTLKGHLRIQGADHFYLENQVTIAYPLEDGQIELHTSSQHPSESQHVTAHALGLADKDVVTIVKRLGGGFGGKESQAAPFAAMAALCAHKLQKPARIVLTKDNDMIITGKRNPFENDFEVGFDATGRIMALDIALYSDAGAYADLSTAIMERAMLHCDNAYFIPNLKVRGQVCKTNHHSHTAFRGFGGPKGVATIEHIIERIAHFLGKDALEIRKLNVYRDEESRNTTHYQQKVANNCLPRLLETLEKSTSYYARKKQIETLNAKDDQFVRGLSLVPVKFGISFTTRFLNQGNAMVIIHQDGTLQITTGATEMGQGVNARIATLVTSELGIPRQSARVMPTRTDKNANTSPTAASAGTDLNGAAALLATRKIKFRLSEFADKLLKIPIERWATHTAGLGTEPEIELQNAQWTSNAPNHDAQWETGIATFFDIEFRNASVFHQSNPTRTITFSDLIREAYLNRISLSDYAHYKIPDIAFNKRTGTGDAFLYFTQGVACSEVKLNRDTGETKVDAVDILMDLGRPINEDLDIGQITGAFVQGMGWVTNENLFYDETGMLLTHAPSTYKIPNIQDTPRHFRVQLLQNDENYANVSGSKAVGEPPLLLALSVWTAIGNALATLARDKKSYPQLKIPATNEEILRAMEPEAFKTVF